MSGEGDVHRPAEPLDLTDEDVAELAGRRSKPPGAIARMRKHVPTQPTGRLVTEAEVPARLSRAELTAMRRPGKSPEAVLRRFTPSEEPAGKAYTRGDDRLSTPGRKPPSAGR